MHSRSPDFRVVCGIDGCPSEYRVYNSFYYHVKRTHAHHLLRVEAAEEEGSARHGLPGAGERTATNDQTNANSVAEADPMHSSVTDEGSSIAIRTVSPYFLHKLQWLKCNVNNFLWSTVPDPSMSTKRVCFLTGSGCNFK